MIDTGVHDAERLAQLQALPLNRKIQITQTRIIEWYQHWKGNVCVSFSGGKDSTVLLHIARQIYPNIPAVFSNTGLEYPEIQKFVKKFDYVDIITPDIRFTDVITSYGYPLISKEVSQAIYYARKIRNCNGKDGSNWIETDRRRNDLMGMRAERKLSCGVYGTGKKWENYHRRCLNGDPNDPNDANLLFVADSDGNITKTKSQFNKDKWLPICQELPAFISHHCCSKMKKQPIKRYQNCHGIKPILATLAEESRLRKQKWIQHGCNAFDSKDPKSQPMSFWTEQDVLAYIVLNELEIASVYGDIVSEDENGDIYSPTDLLGEIRPNLKCTGCDRTGCIFCGFGAHLDKVSRFERLAITHPRQYEYCIGGGKWADNPQYDPTAPETDGEWKNWNPKKIWVPSDKGLGMGKLFDMCNEIMGKRMWRY